MKLNYKRTFLIGFAFMSICAFWQMYDNVIPLLLKYNFNLDETITGFVMALDNILAVILLPIIGTMSDNVDTKWGKRTPFIVVGTIIAVVAMMFLPISAGQKSIVGFIIALSVTLISMSLYRSPAVALMPDLTPKPLRSKGNAVINLMGALGGVYTLVMIMLLDGAKESTHMPIFLGVGTLMIISIIILVLTINEKKIAKQVAEEYPEEVQKEAELESSGVNMSKDVKKSLTFILLSVALWYMAYNAVTSAFSRYAIEVWKLENGGYANCLMIATVAATISYIPLGIISSKIGRKKTIMGGVVLMTLCYLYAAFVNSYNVSVVLGFCLIGIGWAAINVNSFPMVVEMCKESDTGKFTGLYYTFSMSAQIITPILSGVLLQYVSYRSLFPYAVIFSALAFVTMIFVKHGDNKPEMKESILENFDVDD